MKIGLALENMKTFDLVIYHNNLNQRMLLLKFFLFSEDVTVFNTSFVVVELEVQKQRECRFRMLVLSTSI